MITLYVDWDPVDGFGAIVTTGPGKVLYSYHLGVATHPQNMLDLSISIANRYGAEEVILDVPQSYRHLIMSEWWPKPKPRFLKLVPL